MTKFGFINLRSSKVMKVFMKKFFQFWPVFFSRTCLENFFLLALYSRQCPLSTVKISDDSEIFVFSPQPKWRRLSLRLSLISLSLFFSCFSLSLFFFCLVSQVKQRNDLGSPRIDES